MSTPEPVVAHPESLSAPLIEAESTSAQTPVTPTSDQLALLSTLLNFLLANEKLDRILPIDQTLESAKVEVIKQICVILGAHIPQE